LKSFAKLLIAGVLPLCLGACGDEAELPVKAGMGQKPQLPAPNPSTIPTVNIAPAIGWQGDDKPKAASGLQVKAFATDLDHPRQLYVLPNGDVLVAETNGPSKSPEGLRGWIMGLVMKRAGAGVPSANRISLLRDADGDGVAETKTAFLVGLNSPYGMALVGDQLYVANTDALVRFTYKKGDTQITTEPTKVTDLPAFPIDHHWTKNVVASPDGSKLYVAVGSNSNVGENGMENEVDRAALLEIDPATGNKRVFASGLRNPVGMGWQPQSGQLWVSVNERDEIGSDLVPDYMTSVQDGGFYGWPYSYYGQHVDDRIQPQKPDLVAKAIAPDYALGPHTASLGLIFSSGTLLPEPYRNGAFVGQHGSWNRKPLSGYKVIFVPFADGKPSGDAQDVLTGFVNEDGKAHGRPVGVAIDKAGALLVADDVGNRIWRVTPGGPASAEAGRGASVVR
jgi:glucose/arabinose dehydrogenase